MHATSQGPAGGVVSWEGGGAAGMGTDGPTELTARCMRAVRPAAPSLATIAPAPRRLASDAAMCAIVHGG